MEVETFTSRKAPSALQSKKNTVPSGLLWDVLQPLQLTHCSLEIVKCFTFKISYVLIFFYWEGNILWGLLIIAFRFIWHFYCVCVCVINAHLSHLCLVVVSVFDIYFLLYIFSFIYIFLIFSFHSFILCQIATSAPVVSSSLWASVFPRAPYFVWRKFISYFVFIACFFCRLFFFLPLCSVFLLFLCQSVFHHRCGF